jgi:hypothetical protein
MRTSASVGKPRISAPSVNFPILLFVGLASRLSLLALLCMTLVVEIFYPDA